MSTVKRWRETASKAEIEKFRALVREEASPAKGGFLYAFLVAFKRADDDNALILLPAMRKIAKKYELVKA